MKQTVIRVDYISNISQVNGCVTSNGPDGKVLGVKVDDLNNRMIVIIESYIGAKHESRKYAIIETDERLPEMNKTNKFAGCQWKYIDSVWIGGWHLVHVYYLDSSGN